MQIYRTWWHTKYDIKAHLVWCPKYRKRVLYGIVSKRLQEIIRIICMQHDIKIISGKLAVDHVHLFVSYPQKLSVSSMMQYLKWWSSYKILKEYPEIKERYYWWNHFWQRWYLAVSSWSITDELVKEYIDNQYGDEIEWYIELEE